MGYTVLYSLCLCLSDCLSVCLCVCLSLSLYLYIYIYIYIYNTHTHIYIYIYIYIYKWRPIRTVPTRDNGDNHYPEEVEVDRSRTRQGTRCHPSSSRSKEARGTQETRATENHLVKESGGRGSSHGTVMGHLEDAGSGPWAMEGVCCCP